MPEREPNKKKKEVRLPDLPPKKEALGGRMGFIKNSPLPIPPPGFIADTDPATPDKDR